MLLKQLGIAHKELAYKNEYDEKELNEIIEFLSNFKGTYIYPRAIKRKFNIDMVRVYEILNELVEYEVISLAFEVYCNGCDKFQNEVYDALNEIPKNLACEYCGRDIERKKDIIVIYKVKNNES